MGGRLHCPRIFYCLLPGTYSFADLVSHVIADQLVGGPAASRNAQLSITDPKVCRSYLAGTCPHDLFTNTKQDLGPCPKVHSEGLKSEYDLASAHEKSKWGFEYDYLRDIQKYIDECNRRIDTAQRRLEKTPDEIRQTNNLVRNPRLLQSPARFLKPPSYTDPLFFDHLVEAN